MGPNNKQEDKYPINDVKKQELVFEISLNLTENFYPK